MIYQKIRSIFSIVFALALVAALLSTNLSRTAAIGNHLDTTFNGSGLRDINFSGDETAKDVAIQANGKIVVAGTTDAVGTTDNTDFAVARLNPNGLLDNTFNSTGTVVTPVLGDGIVYAVAVQTDGKIVVVGSAVVNGNRQFCLVRYNTNGSLDTGFDGNGIVYTLFEPFTFLHVSEASDVAIQADGKIVVAGYVEGFLNDSFRSDWATARYNTNGSLDTTFDGDGKLTTDFGGHSSNERGKSVVIQPDGKILAGGLSTVGGVNFALARYNIDGSTDFSFGGTGRVITDIDRIARFKSIKLQSDGKIVTAGDYQEAGFDFSLMMRHNTNGSLDNTFGSAGKVFPSGNFIEAIAIQSDGKIVGTGVPRTFRLNPNGSFDAGFGRGGILYDQISGSFALRSIAIQADGKIVAAGRSGSAGEYNFFLARYLAEMGKPFDFDGDGKTDIGIFRPSNGQWWINRSSNNSTFAATFGTSTDKLTPADFTGDGKSDIAFFRPSTGFWFVLRSEDFSFYSFPFGTNGDIPAPADFDGDSKADAAVFRPSTATWYISKSSGGTTIQQFGASGDVPVAGNYDGDDKADIAIFRPSDGQWWIQRSSSGTIAYQFGNSTDKPVPGDYTGDGKSDVAIWRPSTGEWFVLRSENQSYYSFPFGANGDTPAPGDYDGDGKTDATVFRPSSSTWYVMKSTGGNLIQSFGQTNDKPVPNAFVP